MPDAVPTRRTTDRAHDLVLFGATGFTGKLVAEHLAKHHARSLKWAIAGRSEGKLLALRQELADHDPSLESLDVLLADSADEAALGAIARRARVIATTVGPFSKHGLPLVAACAEHGTHYCDITGEVPFIRESIDRYHARAEATGAKVVHTCGFDSIPSDLGVLLLHEHFRERYGSRLARADGYFGPLKGGFSGGTIASMLALMERAATEPAIARLISDPYALVPASSGARGPAKNERLDVRLDAKTGEWVGPFVMAAINTRVVHRTNALLDHAYGIDFRYREEASHGKGPAGLARAAAMTGGLLGARIAMATRPGRTWLSEKLPAPGEGPSKAEREAGHFRVRIFGESEHAPGREPSRAVVTIEGRGDPGYGETAKMLVAAALCLVEGAGGPVPAGVLTPATGLGKALVGRLTAAGMTFRIDERTERG